MKKIGRILMGRMFVIFEVIGIIFPVMQGRVFPVPGILRVCPQIGLWGFAPDFEAEMVARNGQNRGRSWAMSRILRLRSVRSRPKAGCERKGLIYGQALMQARETAFFAASICRMENRFPRARKFILPVHEKAGGRISRPTCPPRAESDKLPFPRIRARLTGDRSICLA